MYVKSKKAIIILLSLGISTLFMSAAAIISYTQNTESPSPSFIIQHDDHISKA